MNLTVCKKYGWATRALAEGHRLLIEGSPRFVQHDGMVLNVYRCRVCQLFHVGNTHPRPWMDYVNLSMTSDDRPRRKC